MSRTEVSRWLEAVDVQHDEAGKGEKLEDGEEVDNCRIARELEDSKDNEGTPTKKGEEKDDIEFLMNIDREILVITVHSIAGR